MIEADMKIGLVTYDFYPPIGGQGVVVHGFHEALSLMNGVQTVVISAADNEFPDHVRIPVGTSLGAGQFVFSAKLALKMGDISRNQRIEILQAYGGPGGVMLLRKPDVPLVYVANHTYAQQHRFLGKSAYRALIKLEARGYGLADRIVAISSTTAQSLIEDYGVVREKVSIIPIGVDTGLFRPLGLKRIPGSVLYAGRLCERKGIPLLIEAIGVLAGDVPDLKLYVVGEGGLRGGLEELASDLGIAERVVFLGKVSDEELVRWYNKVEVFALPSLFEGFGIVCAEAMACGTPVVATHVPGVLDIIDDGRNGILVARDPGELSGAIARVLSKPKLRRDLGREGIRDALERFDWESITVEFVKLYEKVLRKQALKPGSGRDDSNFW